MVRAQDAPPGFIARFDVTQRLEYSDNPDLRTNGDSDLFGRTILNFGLNSVTKVQSFDLNLGTDIEEFRDDRTDDDSVNITNSFVNLNYNRNTRNALIGVFLGYRETDNFSDITDDEFDADGNVIRQDSGTRETYTFRLNGEVGREAPFGATYSWNYSKINYSDTSGNDFDDQTRNDFEGRLLFDISPRITTFIGARYTDLDVEADDGVDREETEFNFGADLIVSRVLTANVTLGYAEIDRSGGQNDTDDGFSGGFGLVLARPDGSWGFDFSTSPETNDNERRSFFTIRRARELQRGNLNYSFGITGAGSDIGRDPLLNVSYSEAVSTGQVSFGMTQRVRTDDDNDESISTSLRANYDHQINSISSVGVGLTLFNDNRLDDNGNDAQRVDLNLNYRHDLTRDWGLVTGYSYSLSKEDNRSDRTRNTIFVGLQRSFNWSP